MEENKNWQKIKLVKLLELLRQDTDEQHPLTTTELCRKLSDCGIPCNRKVLYKDIALLNENGFEIMCKQQGHDKAYYIDDRSFSIPELKIIIDAIQAASFVTKKKTTELIEKVASLGGSHQAEILKNNVVCFNTRKHSNEGIYYNVGFLEEAIQKKRRASFFYFDLNEHGEHVFRKDKVRYVVEPLALIYNNDNYYLLCYNAEHIDQRATYRIDRMEQVAIEEESISQEAVDAFALDEFGAYTEQVFTMFSGDLKTVTLMFEEPLINVVFDKFGEDTKMVRIGEHTLVAEINVQISSAFYGWVFQFGKLMKIVSPAEISAEYYSMIHQAEV